MAHNQIATSMMEQIRVSVKGKGCETLGSDQRVVVLATGLETYPDVSVVCGKVQLAGVNCMAIANPVVLVEVLSKSTEAYDRGEKSAHYRRAGTNEWVLSEFSDQSAILE